MLAQTTTAEDLGSLFAGDLDAFDWITAASVLVGSVIIARVIRAVIMRTLGRDMTGPLADALSKLAQYVVVLLGLFYALSTLGVRVGPLLGALGLGGLVLALAVQGTLENVFAGFLMEARREFRRGDLITTAGHTGVVLDVNARAVVLRTMAGEHVMVPNANVLKEPIVVLTAEPSRRTTLVVGVEYRTDLRKAREVLVRAAAGAEGVMAEPAPDAEVATFADSSIEFHLRFWHGSQDIERFTATGNVARAVKTALDQAGITIAFPQRVLWTGEPLRVEDARHG